MESTFKVYVSPNQIAKLMEDCEYNIRSYEFLGIYDDGDYDANNCSDEEWDIKRTRKMLYLIRLRHEEYLSRLTGVYRSWASVVKAIERRKKDLSEKIFSEYIKIGETKWVRPLEDNYYAFVEVRNLDNHYHTVKDYINLSKYFKSTSDSDLLDALKPFDYKSIRDVETAFGKKEKAYIFIAECLFAKIPTDELWRNEKFTDINKAIDYATSYLLRSE